MKLILTAIGAAALLTGAQAAYADSREHVAIAVPAQGVDFANPAAVARFRDNVERQIAVACNPGDRVGADLAPDFKCRREMASSMEPKVRQLVMAATDKARIATNGLPN